VWASLPQALPWPARVLRVDFVSLADPKPFWVQFYDTGVSEGAWVGDTQAVPWLEGPSFSSVRDSRRRLAIRLAEADGAAPISGSGPKASVTPVPVGTVSRQTRCAPSGGTTSAARSKRLRKVPLQEATAAREDDELSQQVEEVRALVEKAKERQRHLEKEIDQAMASTPDAD